MYIAANITYDGCIPKIGCFTSKNKWGVPKHKFPDSYIKMELPYSDIFPYDSSTFNKIASIYITTMLKVSKYCIIGSNSIIGSTILQVFDTDDYYVGFVTYLNSINRVPKDIIILIDVEGEKDKKIIEFELINIYFDESYDVSHVVTRGDINVKISGVNHAISVSPGPLHGIRRDQLKVILDELLGKTDVLYNLVKTSPGNYDLH
jgi:hypothetical protein